MSSSGTERGASLIALDHHNRPDFGLLQGRMNLNKSSVTASLVSHVPVNFFCFDLLRFDGHDTTGLAWHKRRALLDEIELDGPSWRVPPVFEGDGAAILEAADRLGLEGIMAKRAEAVYVSGKRDSAWRKIKLINRDEFIIIGHTEGSGSRQQSFGALVLGAYDGGDLRFVGSVGTGFDTSMLEWLGSTLSDLERGTDPSGIGPKRPDAHWVEPVLVVEVAYGEWTRGQVLRHPSFIGFLHWLPSLASFIGFLHWLPSLASFIGLLHWPPS
ncbi:MAG: DNA polymerase LigD [Actinomycetia bacterium]|nr:DNA polymerase LigD [Actinomycetes bacterium]